MLKIENLTVNSNNKTILKEFNLNVANGEIISLVGESGSGKTTVIRSILNLLPNNTYIADGNILFNGKSMLSKSTLELQSIRGKDISMIFQDCGSMLNPIRKIGSQYVEYIRTHEKISKKEAFQKAKSILELTHMPDCDNIMNSYPFELSGGMRQRVGIAMAITFHPKLLLADEPTSALDVTIQAQIVRLLMELQKKSNTAIILVTHNLGVASYMSNRIIVMKNGSIVEQGDRDSIIHNPSSEYTKNLIRAIPKLNGERYL